jgi:uncharacterized membrane-anchored protein
VLILSIFLFLAAALCGLVILIAILQDRIVNKTAKYLHGAFAAVALIILIVYVFAFMPTESMLLLSSLILLVIAALGGLTLFTLDRNNKKTPKVFAIVHPLIALAGLIALIAYVLP